MSKEIDRDEMSASKKELGRRRFVRGVGLTIPVLLTIPARSALAGTCSSVSANASIALAHSHNATGDVGLSCTGKSPRVWSKAESNEFGSANQKFREVFGSGPNLTMEEVIKSTDTSIFAKQIATAYVNLSVGGGTIPSGVYDLKTLKDMWTYGRGGTYQPVPGVNWAKGDIQAFLTTTWN